MVKLSRRTVLAGAVAVLVAGLPGVSRAQERAGAVAVVEALHALLLDVMRRAATETLRARHERLSARLGTDFYDYPRMCGAIAGAAWTQAGAEPRAALVEAFAAMSAATYASRFKGYNGERFETLGTRDGPRALVIVDTRIVTGGGQHALSYVVGHIDGRWRIVDVLLDRGISELAVRRSEYAAILSRGGIAALTDALREKAAALLG